MDGGNTRCTTSCTSEGENEHATAENPAGESIAPIDQNTNVNALDMLAAAVANLTAADRAKLAAMLRENANDTAK